MAGSQQNYDYDPEEEKNKNPDENKSTDEQSFPSEDAARENAESNTVLEKMKRWERARELARNRETPKQKAAREEKLKRHVQAKIAQEEKELKEAKDKEQKRLDEINNANYTAPNPKRGGLKWYHALIIPAVWDSITFIFNGLLGRLAMKLILPAQLRPIIVDQNGKPIAFQPKAETMLGEDGNPIPAVEYNQTYNAQLGLQHIQFTVTTHDGAHLETHEFRHNDVSVDQQDYIIRCFGNAVILNNDICNEMREEADRLNCNVVGFNYRNVGKSTKAPRSPEDLVTDLIAQVQRLLDKKVPPGRITLKANSLSGGIATLVTDHFRARGININLFNYRSFSSITNVLVGSIRSAGTGTGYKTTIPGIILGYIAKPIIKFLLLLLRCEIDPVKAYERIDKAHKRHLVVHTSKNGRKGVRPRDDMVIKHYASLDEALTSEKRERRQIKKDLKATIAATYPGESTAQIEARLETAKENHPTKARKFIVNRELKLYDTKTKESIDPSQLDAHSEPLEYLVSRYKPDGKLITGQQYFEEFLQQIQERNRADEEKAAQQRKNKQRYIKIATETVTTTLGAEIKTPPPEAPAASASSAPSFAKSKGK